MLITSCVIIFASCIFGPNLFVYTDTYIDTFLSGVPTYEFFINKILNRNWSIMDFSFGLGTTIFPVIPSLLDPFSFLIILIGVIVGTSNIVYVIIYTQILKIIVCGLLCYKFLKCFKFSSYSVILSSCCYALSGYMIGAGQMYSNVSFELFPIYVLLMLLFIEKSFKNNKFLIVISIITLIMCLISPYLAYMVLLISIVYIIFKILYYSEKFNFIQILKNLFTFAIFIFCGLMISSVIFLPSLNEIINVSNRVSDDTSLFTKIFGSFKFLDLLELKTILLRFFSENIMGTTNNFSGGGNSFDAPHMFFSVLLILCFSQYIINIFRSSNKKEKILKFICIILAIFALINKFIPSAFNIFSYPTFRYTFVLNPFFAIIISDTLDKICLKKYFSKYINSLTVLFSIITIFIFMQKNTNVYNLITVLNCLVCTIAFGILIYFLARSGNNRFKYLILIVLFVNLSLDSFISINASRTFIRKDEYNSLSHSESLKKAIKKINDLEGQNFYRMDQILEKVYFDSPFLHSFIYNYRSLSTYNSVINKNTRKFIENIGNPYVHIPYITSYKLGSYGFPFEIYMANILGLKYIISDFYVYDSNWDLVDEVDDIKVYKNRFLNSTGILYNSYIPEEKYYELNNIEKNILISNTVVLDDFINQDNTIDKLEYIQYKEYGNFFEFEDIKQEGILLDNISDTQNISISCFKEGYIDIPITKRTENSYKYINVLNFSVLPNVDSSIKLSCNWNHKDLVIFEGNINSGEKNNIIVKLPPNISNVKIGFSEGKYSLYDFKLYTNMDIRDYTNNKIYFENSNYGSKVIGTVETKENSILFMPIPYENGWNAFINDVPTKIIKANFGFSAIELRPGKYEILFKYNNPLIKFGALISLSGIIIFYVLILNIKKFVLSD